MCFPRLRTIIPVYQMGIARSSYDRIIHRAHQKTATVQEKLPSPLSAKQVTVQLKTAETLSLDD